MARGAQAQDGELQQSFNMAIDVTKDNVGKLADEMVKESSRYTQYFQNYNQETLQVYREAADVYLEAQKQIYNALAPRLRLDFDIF